MGAPIQAGAMAELRAEEFIPGRVVDHPDNLASVVFHPDRDAVGGEFVGEVCCAVQRVDDPFVAGGGLLGQASFLCQDWMTREGLVDDVDDALFRLVVRIGDQVDELFMFNAKTGARTFGQNGSGLTGCINSDRKHCIKWDVLIIGLGHEKAS